MLVSFQINHLSMRNPRCALEGVRYYCGAGVKRKKRKKEKKKVVRGYFPLGRDSRNSGCVSF